MSKRFYFMMFCVFVCLALVGFFIGGLPVASCFNIFMACLYLAKIINA